MSKMLMKSIFVNLYHIFNIPLLSIIQVKGGRREVGNAGKAKG